VHWTGRCLVRELAYGVANAAPHRRAIVIILGGKFIGARGAFLEGLGPVALEHEVGGAPDVDLGSVRWNNGEPFRGELRLTKNTAGICQLSGMELQLSRDVTKADDYKRSLCTVTAIK
jgi:hypothetical protein